MGRDTLASASAKIQSNVVKAITGYFRLKDFIHAVRACKTLAEERTLVARESAAIRTSFKEDVSSEQLYHAISKLLFIYMMGYPAHFGQVESLKMVALPRISEKRLGYLGSTQFMDEQQPTLTLITNSIKSDLNNASNIIMALALTNLAMTASPDIARDLANEAAFCASKLISRVPELSELFESKVQGLLGDRDHAVVLGGLSLVTQLCKADITFVMKFKKIIVPILIRQIQSIISGGYSSDYDVGGTSDPFLQIKILRILRIFGEGDVESSEIMADILTQISTSTDPNKNVGHSVLYETAVTIMHIKSDHSLRTMAINILGRLLSTNSTDTNLRYVALTLLNKIIYSGSEGLSTVQRHRATILDCLHDPDVSIKRRAVDLSIALASKETVKNIANELLGVLDHLKGTDEFEFKQSIVTRLAIAVAQFTPSAKWYVDMMIRILSHIDDVNTLGLGSKSLSSEILIGKKEEIVSTFVRIINNSADLHRYATEQLYRIIVLKELLDESERESATISRITEAMLQATVWTIGEFADILLGIKIANDDQIINLLADWASPSNGYTAQFIGYVITALGKLSNRLQSSRIMVVSKLLTRIASDYVNTHDLHFRALEMKSIVNNSGLRSTLLGRIPPDAAGDRLGYVSINNKFSGSHLNSVTSRNDTLLSDTNSPPETPRIMPEIDMFAELATLSLDGATTPVKIMNKREPTYSNDDVAIYFAINNREDNGTVGIGVEIENRGKNKVRDILLQCAVPKSMKLQMLPASSSIIFPKDFIAQTLQVTPSDFSAKVKLRVKISYWIEDHPHEYQFDVTDLD